MIDDNAKPTPPQYTIGRDISTFSVDELKRTIALLKDEIIRLERELEAKDSTKAAAEALFRRS